VSATRRSGFALLTVVLVALVLEGIAWLAFATALRGKQLQWRDLDDLGPVPTQAEMDAWRAWGWDRELGWLRRPNTEETVRDPHGDWHLGIDSRGARREPLAFPGGVISAYGDSFTFGHEIDDDETWPHYLSERLGTRVDNWGQSAWGPDQALLRLARNLPHERTAVVVLAIMSENIARLLNCYRPFLTGEAAMKMAFKPMLVFESEGLVWQPNPLARADTPADWEAALAQARATDVWYRENRERVRARFPHLLRLPEAIAYAARHPSRPNLYERPDAVARLDHLFDDFTRLADTHDFLPVVLFIPEPSDLRRLAAGSPTRYRDYVAARRARSAATRLLVLDVTEHRFDLERFNRRPFKDHPSPYGQQMVAEALATALADFPPVRALRAR
jgi:hypothetical protein